MADIHVEHVASCLCNSLLFERRNNMDGQGQLDDNDSSRYRLAKKNKNSLFNYTSF